jgi:hypothetical protein
MMLYNDIKIYFLYIFIFVYMIISDKDISLRKEREGGQNLLYRFCVREKDK